VAVGPGWNLVGPSSPFGAESYHDFLGGVGSVLVDPSTGWGSSSGPAADTTDLVNDGYGYWLYSSQAGGLAGAISTPQP
jgi:hypothetical protein